MTEPNLNNAEATEIPISRLQPLESSVLPNALEENISLAPDSAKKITLPDGFDPIGNDGDELDILEDFDDEEVDLDDEGSEGSGDRQQAEEEGAGDLEERIKEEFRPEEMEEILNNLTEMGLVNFVQYYLGSKEMPIERLLLAFGFVVPPSAGLPFENLLHILRILASRILRNRIRLSQYSTPQDAVELIRKSKNILVLTGAGVSTSCGIPDFRSENGLYARLKEEGDEKGWELDDPQQMFDIQFFRENPRVFYSFAKDIFPANFVPSPCHRFIKEVERKEKLLRNYTQNIDTLEDAVGIKKVLTCHGSFATASCIQCGTQVPGSSIKDDILLQRVPYCKNCPSPSDSSASMTTDQAMKVKGEERKGNKRRKLGEWDEGDGDDDDDDAAGPEDEWKDKPIMKPDITFFGEKLSDEFDKCLMEDREKVDLLIVIGTSLKVAPVSEITSHIPHSVPQILINRDPVTHVDFDVCLLGDADDIVRWLCSELNKGHQSGEDQWDIRRAGQTDERSEHAGEVEVEPTRVGESHVWLFKGAKVDGTRSARKWIEMLEKGEEGADIEDDEEDEHGDEDEDEGEGEEAAANGKDGKVPGERETDLANEKWGGGTGGEAEGDGLEAGVKRKREN